MLYTDVENAICSSRFGVIDMAESIASNLRPCNAGMIPSNAVFDPDAFDIKTLAYFIA